MWNLEPTANDRPGGDGCVRPGFPARRSFRSVAQLLSNRRFPGFAWQLPLILFGVFVAGCGPQKASQEPPKSTEAAVVPQQARDDSTNPWQFVNRIETSNIDFQYRDGVEAGVGSIVEIVGGGVGVIDFDRDGQLDLILPGGGSLDPQKQQITGLPTGVYRGLGDWKFRDVGQVSNLGESRYYSHGALCADFNSDGFDDVLITGYGGLQLFANQGDGTFVDVAADAGLTDTRWSVSGAWGDFDRDGNLDVFVSRYVNWSWDNHPLCTSAINGTDREVCGPRFFDGLDDSIYYSDGRGGFRESTPDDGLTPLGRGLGVLTADLDQDGWTDVYVANDAEKNYLYLNQKNGKFKEKGLVSGVAVGENASENGSMGLAIGDYNLDGLFDLWVTNFESESFALYRGLKQPGRFRFSSREAGLTEVRAVYVGWGTAFADLDLDGDEDLPVVNGHVYRYPINNIVLQPTLLWENRDGRFINVGEQAGEYFAGRHLGRGLAIADLDHNGLPDILIANINEPPALLDNRSTAKGNALTIDLVGTRSNRNAIGAVVTVEAAGKSQIRQQFDGGSFGTTHQRRLFFGLGESMRVDRLEVLWPNGDRQTWTDLPVNQSLQIVEGSPEPLVIVDRAMNPPRT